MKQILFTFFLISSFALYAQETNGGKRLYAKSMLNQKGPALTVMEWLTEAPDTKGKFVLIDYSATWCHACRKSMPELNDYQKKFADKLVVIFITKESLQKVNDAKNFRCELSMAIDTLNRSANALQIKGIPHNVLLDPKGYVRWEGFPATRDFELTEEVLVSLFEKYSPGPSDIYKVPKIRKVLPEPSFAGPVKQLTEIDYTPEGDEKIISKGSILGKRLSFYDVNGNLIEERFYRKGDTLVNLTKSTFDNKGKVLKRICYDSLGKVYTTTIFSYNTKGLVNAEVITNEKNNVDCKSSYTYDKNGKLVEEQLFTGSGKLIYKTVYHYNNNNLIEKTIYNGNNDITSRFIATYNQAGQPLESSIYGKSLLHRYSYAYDIEGKLIEERVYTPNNLLSSIYSYTYDEAGNRIDEKVTYPDGKSIIRYAYRYDNQHKQVETYRFDYDEIYLESKYDKASTGDMVIWNYWNQGKPSTTYINTYQQKDENGNWLKRTKVANNRPVGYTERQLQYHFGLAQKSKSK